MLCISGIGEKCALIPLNTKPNINYQINLSIGGQNV